MEMRDLLEKMMKFAGEKTGQKPGDQWKGTDPNPPGKKLVGDSILKDLSKGKSPKSKEQELAEEFQAFLEAEFRDTVDKRPRRKSDRHPRGHKPQSGYKTVKTDDQVDEGNPVNVHALMSRADHSGTTAPWWAKSSGTHYMGSSNKEPGQLQYKLYFPKMFDYAQLWRDINYKEAVLHAQQLGFEQDDQGSWYLPVYTMGALTKDKLTRSKYYFGEKPKKVLPKPEEIDESTMSEKDIELQDYRSMTNQEFQTAYGMSKTEWINQNKALVIQNPDIKRALGLEEAESQEYTVVIDRRGREKPVTGTMEELLGYFGYTLEVGKSYEHERGRYKINMNPRNINQLVDALNKAASNGAANGAPSTYYSVGNGQLAESHYKWEVIGSDGKVKAVYHHNSPHYKDQTAASDIAYTLKSNPGTKIVATKDDQPFDWQGLLSEGWESGPEEYKEPYDDADDAYERHRQEKIDTEAEREWAKLPKVSTYKLLGRGPNMEPNYEFGGKEYDTLEAAIEARKQLMADPKTPHPEHIGIQTLTRVVDKTNEAIDSDIVQPMGQDTFNRAGYNPIRDERDYLDTLSKLTNLSRKPGLDKSMQDHITQRIRDLNAEAFKKGFIKAESRGHKIIATKLKDIERSKKFASGELKIPTPQERQAQLKKLEKAKPVKEYGADNISPYGQPATTPGVDPKQLAQGMQQFKAATGSTAPTTNLAKAIDTLSQGKLPTQQMVKDIQPAMKDLATITQNPNLASGAAKTAFQQANQARIKQQQLAKK